MRQLFRELKRRNVYKVAVTYAAVAFVTLQAARLIFPATTLEGLYNRLVVLAFVGFPIALVIAWAFELTPEGIQRSSTEEGEREEATPTSVEERRPQTRLAMKALVGLGLVAAAAAGGWYLVGGGGEHEPRVGDRSIAVLPFEALGQQEPDVFTEGMHDDLLARLSNVSGLKVISRTSVQQYRDTRKTTADIARELGVRWVLEGGVQEMGDEIQVNAQLIDPRTDTHAWADSYRRDLTAASLFDLQSEITKRIATSLEAELSPEETERVERRPTEDLDAYRLYVRGRTQLNARTAEGMGRAVEYFQRAIAQDSGYALAWSGLADAIGLYPAYSPDSGPSSLPDHEQAARQALELDPDLAEARASMGYLHILQQKGPAALRELRRAVELKPSYAQAHHWLGWTYLHLGQLDRGREHLSLAVELAPDHTTARTALAYPLLAQGKDRDAESHLSRIPEGRRHLGQYLEPMAYLLASAGRWSELETLTQSQLERDAIPGWRQAMFRFYQARIAVRRDDTANARQQLADLRQLPPSLARYVYQGLLSAALGEPGDAFAAWEKIEPTAAPSVWTLRYLYPELLGPLRDDPRYRDLIRRINQQWGLNPDGSLPEGTQG